MSGNTLTKIRPKPRITRITVTPEMAIKLLEKNQLNRPLSQAHVQRIARQIKEHKWCFT